MAAKPYPHADKTRSRLLAAGWVLLAVSLLLGIVGPRLTASNMPPDIGSRVGDVDWIALGWIVFAMIVGALAAMCFVAQWVLRPRKADGAHLPGRTQSK